MSIRMWKKRPVGDVRGEDGKPRRPVASFAVASYLNEEARRADALACFLYSVRAQTYPNWEVVVVHDGPVKTDYGRKVWEQFSDDPRFRMIETPVRKGDHGHHWRQLGIESTTGDFVAMGNDDNYVAPTFVEAMLSALTVDGADFTFCDMLHSHRGWQKIDSRIERGKIDVGNWMAAAKLVKSVPWTRTEFAADWFYVEALKKKARKVVKVQNTLFCHN